MRSAGHRGEVSIGLWTACLGVVLALGATPARGQWVQQARLSESDADYYGFGYSVAISGDILVIGAPGASYADVSDGAVYVFERGAGSGNSWGLAARLMAPDATGRNAFGTSVAIDGDTILVGAYGDHGAGSNTGAAYVFHRDAGGADQWGQVAKLTASDAAKEDVFGWAVALCGDTAVVGAPWNDDTGKSSGSAYVFSRDCGGAGHWGQAAKLLASDAAALDHFGEAVAVCGQTVLVGGPQDDDGGGGSALYDSGSAYLFQRNAGGTDHWGEVGKLSASDAALGDEFGGALAISGETIVVGGTWHHLDGGHNKGSVYVFEPSASVPGQWDEVAILTASDAAMDDWFGSSVAVCGDLLVVGAYGNDDDGDSSGSVYIFQRDESGPGNWGQVAKLTASDAAQYGKFGWSTSVSDSTVLVGGFSWEIPTDKGAGYLFTPEPATLTLVALGALALLRRRK